MEGPLLDWHFLGLRSGFGHLHTVLDVCDLGQSKTLYLQLIKPFSFHFDFPSIPLLSRVLLWKPVTGIWFKEVELGPH